MHGRPLAIKVVQMVIPHDRTKCESHTVQTTNSFFTMKSPNKLDTKQQSNRRASGHLRSDFLDKGAFLIEFAQPPVPLNMFQREPPLGFDIPLVSDEVYEKFKTEYRTMERKGFLVTSDTGCLIPHEQYSTTQKGATRKGHQRAFAFFGRWCPKQGTTAERNLHGWPSTQQISHKCHRRNCCRPDHLLSEEQWRNLKRNYCGHDGSCDCGSEIKCIRTYQLTEDVDISRVPLCKTVQDVRRVLVGAPNYTVHGKDRFANRDNKAAVRTKRNQKKRKRATELNDHASDRKQRRMAERASGGSEAKQDEEVDLIGVTSSESDGE